MEILLLLDLSSLCTSHLFQVNGILKKPTEERTPEELRILEQSPDIASAVQKRSKHRQLAKDRTQEVNTYLSPSVINLAYVKMESCNI